jgi:hypothetical protein
MRERLRLPGLFYKTLERGEGGTAYVQEGKREAKERDGELFRSNCVTIRRETRQRQALSLINVGGMLQVRHCESHV